VSVSLPSGLLANDVCIGQFSLDNSSDTVTSVPSGWTSIRADTTGSSGVASFWYWYNSLGDGNDPATVTVAG